MKTKKNNPIHLSLCVCNTMMEFLLIFVSVLIASATAQSSFVISANQQIHMVDGCGVANATGITGSNVFAYQDEAYFQQGQDLLKIDSMGQSSTVCTTCVPAGGWVVYNDSIVGFSNTDITRTPFTTGTSTTVHTADGTVQALGIVGNVIYWAQLNGDGSRQLWAATYPTFGTPTSNPDGLIENTYSGMIVDADMVLMYGEEAAEEFRARDDPTLPVLDRRTTTIPPMTYGPVVGATAIVNDWVYVTRDGALAETLTRNCLMNVTISLPTPVNSVAGLEPSICTGLSCFQVTPVTSTSASRRLDPNYTLIIVALFVLLMYYMF